MEQMIFTGDQNLVDPGFKEPPQNPLHLLQQWLAIADKLKVVEPRDLVLSTVDTMSRPSSRVVLIKKVDDRGVIFASSDVSQKGRDLIANPIAAGTLWWRETMQQINFKGHVTKLSESVSNEIFQNRTREAQAATAISHQSATMINEQEFRESVSRLVQTSGEISRPKTWHGYYVMIEVIEFWHGSKDRLHNRLRYDFENGVWQHKKLQP